MIDKLVLTKNDTVTIIYTDKSAVTLTTDQGDPLALFNWLMTPTVVRLSDYKQAVASAEEVTQRIAA